MFLLKAKSWKERIRNIFFHLLKNIDIPSLTSSLSKSLKTRILQNPPFILSWQSQMPQHINFKNSHWYKLCLLIKLFWSCRTHVLFYLKICWAYKFQKRDEWNIFIVKKQRLPANKYCDSLRMTRLDLWIKYFSFDSASDVSRLWCKSFSEQSLL